jgi:hypothetical protein
MASREQRPLANDDVLSGFDQTGASRTELRGFFTTSILASLYIWDTTFNLGAYHTVFFQQTQGLLVTAVVILLGILVVRRQIQVHAWLLALFVPPVLLVIFRFATPVKHPGGGLRLVDACFTAATFVVVPIIGWVTARLLAPEFFALPGRRLKTAVVAIAATMGVLGYLAGAYNNRILTCEDFVVSGVDTPANCRHARRHEGLPQRRGAWHNVRPSGQR